MTVESLISNTTPPLKKSDTVEYALGLLMEFRVRHLPVVDDHRKIIGTLSEERMLDASGPDVTVDSLLVGTPVIVRPDSHIFDVSRIMLEHDLTTVPVSGSNNEYVGLVRRYDLFGWFARISGTQEPGAILALEIAERDYSLSQLTYLIEQNDVGILSVSTEHSVESKGNMCVTVKLNSTDATRIRHILEHHGYKVVAAFGEDESDEELSERVQEFLRYLEV